MADRPERMVPDNEMPFDGIKNPGDRASVIFGAPEEITKMSEARC